MYISIQHEYNNIYNKTKNSYIIVMISYYCRPFLKTFLMKMKNKRKYYYNTKDVIIQKKKENFIETFNVKFCTPEI